MRDAPKLRAPQSPPARQLRATRQRRLLVGNQTLQAFDPRAVVGWRTFLVPSEVFYATGVVPFTPELVCAALSRNQDLIQRTIEHAEEAGYSLKQCSFLKTIVGGLGDGLLPAPNIVIGSSCFCSGIGAVFHEAAHHFGCPFVYLNLPLHADVPAVVDHVAAQLQDLTRLLCGMTGIEVAEVEKSRLPMAVQRANEASRYWKEVEQLRKSVPSPLSGREALDFASVLSQHWGSEEIIQVYRSLLDEVRQRVDSRVAAVPNEIVRLFWLHLRPYYSDAIMRWIEGAGGAVVFEEVNYPARLPMDPDDPYRSLAREILLNSGRYRAFTDEWREDIRSVVRDFKVDGVIHFAHENCAWSESVFPPEYRFIRDDLRLPIVSIDGDCLVRGRDNLMQTRVLSFVENVVARKMGVRARTVATPSRRPRRQRAEHFVGVDVGSATIKVVVLDSDLTIRSFSILPTGSDNKRAVGRAFSEAWEGMNGASPDAVRGVVATGIGRANVPFPHEEVTEILCHTRGVLHLKPDARTIIDIGGQDTKAILVEQSISRLNASCAAGTGKFLEVIAAAMGLDAEQMNALDEAAERAAPISKMCTVFAESEVVNRIACGADVGQIARGVHEMVASKAATLVKQLSVRIMTPVVFTGGVARNAAVVRALERMLGRDIHVPENPQISGALGAAVLAVEKGGAGVLAPSLLPE
jgi:predicted CoA-substrate-specific enzyme activase